MIILHFPFHLPPRSSYATANMPFEKKDIGTLQKTFFFFRGTYNTGSYWTLMMTDSGRSAVAPLLRKGQLHADIALQLRYGSSL